MTYAWIITEGHESDIVGILDEGYSDDLLAVRRPALINYGAGGYILANGFLPYSTVDLSKNDVLMCIERRRALFIIKLPEESTHPLIVEYRKYIEDSDTFFEY